MQGAGLGKQVGGFFDTMVLGPGIQDLITSGYLSAPITFAPPVRADLKGIRMMNGDYERHELNLRMDKEKITGDAVDHYRRICPGQPAIAFCVSISHAEHVAEKFNAAGIRAAMISGAMDNRAREFRIKALGNGQIKVLTSCEIISEGTDIPIVAAAILLRPTKSTGLYIQQCGRALRVFPGKKNTYILDHVGNAHRFGLIDDPRTWTLDADPRRKNNQGEIAVRLRSCPKCYTVFSIYKMVCPQCGTATIKQERQIDEVEGTLEQIDRENFQKEMARRDAMKERASANTYEALERLARQRGYKPGWAQHVWNARLESQRRFAKAV
jgi:superfamily II DNA or RNA helicase